VSVFSFWLSAVYGWLEPAKRLFAAVYNKKPSIFYKKNRENTRRICGLFTPRLSKPRELL